jgi:hypothetical protein
LDAVSQATLAHKFGEAADRLVDCGIAPDLVATAAGDLGREFERLIAGKFGILVPGDQ